MQNCKFHDPLGLGHGHNIFLLLSIDLKALGGGLACIYHIVKMLYFSSAEHTDQTKYLVNITKGNCKFHEPLGKVDFLVVVILLKLCFKIFYSTPGHILTGQT